MSIQASSAAFRVEVPLLVAVLWQECLPVGRSEVAWVSSMQLADGDSLRATSERLRSPAHALRAYVSQGMAACVLRQFGSPVKASRGMLSMRLVGCSVWCLYLIKS